MLQYFMAVWHILWRFGIFRGYLVYFSRFGKLYQENKQSYFIRVPTPIKLDLY
jgi:hypothetical protein